MNDKFRGLMAGILIGGVLWLWSIKSSVTAPVPLEPQIVLNYYIVRMNVSAYCLCEKCCGMWAIEGLGDHGERITASGSPAKGFLVAAPRKYRFGTKMSIPGYAGGCMVSVEDRGGAIKDNKIDLLMSSHKAALQWGRQFLDVKVYF